MQTLLSVFAAAVCLGLPGLAVMVWLARPGQPVWEFVAEVAASSLALTSLCALFFFVIGVAPGGWGAGVYLGLCVVSVAAAWLRNGMPRLERADRLPLLLGTVAFAGLLALRFSQSSGLALPNWVDSVHHSLIVRKIIEYGGLPLDLTPYLNVPLSYHYGFHISTALFAFLSGLPSDQAVLWFGQVINALVSLSIYRLGRAVGLDRRAAFLAALVLDLPRAGRGSRRRSTRTSPRSTGRQVSVRRKAPWPSTSMESKPAATNWRITDRHSSAESSDPMPKVLRL